MLFIWRYLGNQIYKIEYANESLFELRTLSKHITRAAVLIVMYETFYVDNLLYDLKLEAVYVWTGKAMSPLILASNASALNFRLFSCLMYWVSNLLAF